MTNYDSFSHCHLTDIFFAIHALAKELIVFNLMSYKHCNAYISVPSCISFAHSAFIQMHGVLNILVFYNES